MTLAAYFVGYLATLLYIQFHVLAPYGNPFSLFVALPSLFGVAAIFAYVVFLPGLVFIHAPSLPLTLWFALFLKHRFFYVPLLLAALNGALQGSVTMWYLCGFVGAAIGGL